VRSALEVHLKTRTIRTRLAGVALAATALAAAACLTAPSSEGAEVLLSADFEGRPDRTFVGTGGAAAAEPVHVDPQVLALVRQKRMATSCLVVRDDASEAGSVRFQFAGNRAVSRGRLTLSAVLGFPFTDEYAVLVRERGTSAAKFLDLRFRPDGTVHASDAAGAIGTIGRYDATRSYGLTLVFDLDRGTSSVYLDGCLALEGRRFGIRGTGIGALLFGVGADPQRSGALYVDDILVSSEFRPPSDERPPEIACPGDTTVEAVSRGGVRRSDSQLDAFFERATASDACDGNPKIAVEAPDFLPLGRTDVTFTARDAAGNAAACRAAVTVADTRPPRLSIRLSRDCLWPPNHVMSELAAYVTAVDDCDAAPAVSLAAIWSDEPDSGDGTRAGDVADAEFGARDETFRLRSERDSRGDGRVYTIVYTATDASGNAASDTVFVRVPRDRLGAAYASSGFTPDGGDFEPGASRYSLVIRSREKLHASRIAQATVGNHAEVLAPVERVYTDVNGDGLDDLQLFFDVERTRELMAGGRTIGMRYETKRGTGYLVPDIFALRPRVEGAGALAAGGPAVRPPQPNPFSATTEIRYVVRDTVGARVDIGIEDHDGRRIRTLVSGDRTPGTHAAVWDGRDERGTLVPAGIYLYVASVDGQRASGRVIVMR